MIQKFNIWIFQPHFQYNGFNNKTDAKLLNEEK